MATSSARVSERAGAQAGSLADERALTMNKRHDSNWILTKNQRPDPNWIPQLDSRTKGPIPTGFPNSDSSEGVLPTDHFVLSRTYPVLPEGGNSRNRVGRTSSLSLWDRLRLRSLMRSDASERKSFW